MLGDCWAPSVGLNRLIAEAFQQTKAGVLITPPRQQVRRDAEAAPLERPATLAQARQYSAVRGVACSARRPKRLVRPVEQLAEEA